ncbi:HAD family hydrolase [Paenibacillus sp. CF384]|uniref:HAD family hydrolase n=1 Tax=Paenibacillus sp. CF384 TaxID=1884382 RepID=UPI0008946EC5|nr:HAD family hydrolase [Paenibacillus sp. CF384]SDW23775.1 putative hydrolase of the HAD superfamily [Paenibacillus sp. CF384]
MTVKAVFFDLFETLITEFEQGKRVSNRNYDYSTLLGISNADFKKEWSLRQEKRMNGHFVSYGEVLRDIALARNLEINEDSIQYLYQARKEEKKLPFHAIQSEIIELLTELRSHPLKLGLISNCTEEEVTYWPDSPISAFFDDVVFSFDAKCSKPDARIYEIACERLHVKPEECVFVGDGGSNELEGASRAGMRVYHAFWFNTYVQSDYRKLRSPKDLVNELWQARGR